MQPVIAIELPREETREGDSSTVEKYIHTMTEIESSLREALKVLKEKENDREAETTCAF
jgi:hypothetical protein